MCYTEVLSRLVQLSVSKVIIPRGRTLLIRIASTNWLIGDLFIKPALLNHPTHIPTQIIRSMRGKRSTFIELLLSEYLVTTRSVFLDCSKLQPQQFHMSNRAKVLIVGFTGRKIPSIPANYILIKQLSVLGCRVNETIKRSENGDEILAKRMKSLLEMAANKKKSLKPFISHVFEFNVKGVRQAFRCLLNRNVVGRVCVSSEIDSKL